MSGPGDESNDERAVTETANLRVVVDRIEGRSVCGMSVGDSFEVTNSCQLRIPDGQPFCYFALAAALPLLAAKQRPLDPDDWMARDSEVACPDPDERLVMRIEITGTSRQFTDELM